MTFTPEEIRDEILWLRANKQDDAADMLEYLLQFSVPREETIEECANIAKRFTDDETRQTLGVNVFIVASQIERAILALKCTLPQEKKESEQ